MKQSILALAALFLVLHPAQAEPVFQRGSRIGLTPTPGMKASERFNGFENPDRLTSIQFREWPGTSHAQLVSALNGMGGEKDVMKVSSREELTINGNRAYLLAGIQDSARGEKLSKWILAISDPTLSAMAVAQSVDPAEGGYSDEEMRSILKTIRFRPPPLVEDDLAALPYAIGERADFRLVQVQSNFALFTEGPSDRFVRMEQPQLVVSVAFPLRHLAKLPKAQQEDFIRQLALGDPDLKDPTIESMSLSAIPNGQRHEVVVRGKDVKTGREAIVLLSVLVTPETVISVLGTTKAERRESDLPRFLAFARNVAVKP